MWSYLGPNGMRGVGVLPRLFDQKLRAHLRLDIKWTLKYFPSARSTSPGSNLNPNRKTEPEPFHCRARNKRNKCHETTHWQAHKDTGFMVHRYDQNIWLPCVQQHASS